jgi:hypothetical protein
MRAGEPASAALAVDASITPFARSRGLREPLGQR